MFNAIRSWFNPIYDYFYPSTCGNDQVCMLTNGQYALSDIISNKEIANQVNNLLLIAQEYGISDHIKDKAAPIAAVGAAALVTAGVGLCFYKTYQKWKNSGHITEKMKDSALKVKNTDWARPLLSDLHKGTIDLKPFVRLFGGNSIFKKP